MSKRLATLVAVAVILSTLAGVASAAPGTPRVTEAGAISDDGIVAQESPAGRDLESGGTYWSGDGLRFDASRIVPEGANEADRTFELWRVADDGRLNQRVRTFTVDGSGTTTLRTGRLAGQVAIRYGEQIVYVHEGVGYLESPPDGSPVTAGSSAFELVRQTLAFSWSDPTVYPGQRLTLDVTSNRDDYVVAVSGDGLSYENLKTLFPASAYAENHDARSNDSVLLLRGGASTSFRLDTAVLPPGERSVEFDVVDTATVETARLTVHEPEKESRFVSLERRENVGDVIEANLSCTHCFLVVGGPGQGVLDVVEIEDANGDGHVSLRINTRYVGMYEGASGFPNGVEAYASPADSVSRYHAGAALEQVREELNYNVATLSELRDQQGLEASGRDRPLPPGRVDLTLASSDFIIDRSAYGDQPPSGGQLVVRDQTDVRTVVLEPRRLDGVQVLGAPDESEPGQDVERLRDVAAARDTVALGDDLVFRVDLAGVFGYFAEFDPGIGTLVENREEGIYLRIDRLPDDSSGSASRVRLDRTSVRYLTDPAGDSLYLVVETGEIGPDRFQPGRYRLSFELRGVEGKYDAYSTRNSYEGYPYLDPGASQSASATATISPPEAAITEPSEEAPRMNADGELVVGGTTNVAPESHLRVTAASTEFSWETSTRATIEGEGTGNWAAALPLAEAPGDEFTVSVSRGGERLDERTYTVRPPAENSSEGGGSGDGSGSNGGAGGPLGSDGGVLSTISGLSGLAVPIVGGVGVLVVLWAAWRLVVRRMLV